MHGRRLIAATVQGVAAWAVIGLAAPLGAQDAWRATPAVYQNTLQAAESPASTDRVYPAARQEPVAEAAPSDARRTPPAPTVLSKPQRESLPLKPPSRQADSAGKPVNGLPSIVTVAGSLAIVLGLFFALIWFLKRGNPKANALLPQEVVEVLGRAPLDGRQQLHLLRCGRKLLLVSVTPAGAETLTEITEPTEVDRLAGLCMQTRPNSATAAFRHVLQQFSSQTAVEESGDYAPREEARRG